MADQRWPRVPIPNFDPSIVRRLHCTVRDRKDRSLLTLAVDRALDNPLIDLDDATKVQTGAGRRIVRIGKTIAPYDAIDTGIFLASPALVGAIAASLDAENRATAATAPAVTDLVAALAQGVRAARLMAAE